MIMKDEIFNKCEARHRNSYQMGVKWFPFLFWGSDQSFAMDHYQIGHLSSHEGQKKWFDFMKFENCSYTTSYGNSSHFFYGHFRSWVCTSNTLLNKMKPLFFFLFFGLVVWFEKLISNEFEKSVLWENDSKYQI